ncbi:hypothetical protein LGH82_31290 [Mesorhizobium sp. PAMC28654]|uniref:hypothetical protein n=1 Tax=Mesorhizobium sp. PAMC28654 TaxID=2880934 RepID=UPI001D09D9A8|nr:hypothetical protein [Mesorhizobium sp. PAMC28654]UDL89487.1 hypothetical protein LGH82_31290 [Mesorhizobium sp. PAMC28654]
MVHIIPLSIANRRLDTGNAVQYPQGSPIGRAMQGFGDELSAVAARYLQMKDQQEAFDAELKRRQFNGRVAQVEDEVTANASADGAGLHDAMYSAQVDPRGGKVVKPSLFDMMFDEALPNMPESQRAAFANQKDALRRIGSLRMAQRQLQRRNDYEQAQVDTALKTSAIAIGKANPDDHVTFEAARQQGLDLIDKMGVDPGIRQQMVKDWFGTAAKMRFEALIAKDPKRALEIFGVGMPGETSDSAASRVQPVGWIRVSGTSDAAAAKGDRVGKPTPDEILAQAFRDDLPSEKQAALARKAELARTAQKVELRTNIGLAEQNAPTPSHALVLIPARCLAGTASGSPMGSTRATGAFGTSAGGPMSVVRFSVCARCRTRRSMPPFAMPILGRTVRRKTGIAVRPRPLRWGWS